MNKNIVNNNVLDLKVILSEMGVLKEFSYETPLENIGFDSLKILELVVMIEQAFDIEIEDDDLEGANFQTIGTVLELIERTKQKC
ncbi:acyl carrier protein [Lysinibacillus sp. NPDC097231]|uniref:acyl carrier protein n=1 Tax=Lysinibacillus sp. NPDC097231 TaxID=3364142 RepID=UPI003805F7F0